MKYEDEKSFLNSLDNCSIIDVYKNVEEFLKFLDEEIEKNDSGE